MGLFTKELAIDLGTSNTIIISNGRIIKQEELEKMKTSPALAYTTTKTTN
jgi:actin-like ATPase involved in cell morphogenesis